MNSYGKSGRSSFPRALIRYRALDRAPFPPWAGGPNHGVEHVRRVQIGSALVASVFPVLGIVYDLLAGYPVEYARNAIFFACLVCLGLASYRFAPAPVLTYAIILAMNAGFVISVILPHSRGAYIVIAAVAVPYFYFIGGARVGRASSLSFMAIMAATIATVGSDSVRAIRALDPDFRIIFMVLAFLAIQMVIAEASELRHRQSLEIIHDEHFVDEATGLPNANALSSGSLGAGETISLIRLRNFKDLRIFYDDAEGRAMAARASEILRDLAAAELSRGPYRVSDAEFALVHPRGADPRAAAKAVFRAFARSSVAGDSPLRFDVQIGSYRTGSGGGEADRAIEEAEAALADCVAEDTGASYRDGSAGAAPSDDLKARAPVLVRNIGDRSLSAVFQPVYDVSRDGIGFLEALTRLRAEGGYVSPESYLAASARLGLEKHFGDFIIEAALDMARRSGHTVSINVPFRDLERPYFVDTLFRAYSSLSGKRNTIAVELTEQAAVSDYSRLRAFFAEVHEAGGLVMLDDFGTGYSNYASLLEARFDAVKVAGDIVKEIASRREAAELYFGLCAFSRAAGLAVVAEHISDGAILARALEGGAGLLQGYYFSKPLPADDILGGKLSFPDGMSAAPQPLGRA
jgi:c-di-GMP phosphodiesterase